MADKRIQDLTPASSVQTSDKFVLEQSGQAKSLTGQILINDLATYLDGHGGISNISYTAPSSGELDGTLTVTLADETEETFTITNGKGIVSISKTGTEDLVDEYTIEYNDDTSSVFYVTNGEKGDTGEADHLYIKWADASPTQDSDMLDYPSNYIGVATSTSDTAPTEYTDYEWYEYKGETGDTGNGIASVTLESSSGLVDTYKVLFTDTTYTTFNVTNGSQIDSITKTSSSGLTDTYTVTLTNGDTTSFQVSNGKSIVSVVMTSGSHAAGTTDVYTITYNDGDTSTFSVYNGANGLGAVSTVSGIQADGTGDVPQVISGNGAPTTATVGQRNQLYYDLNDSIIYYCVGESGGTYIWQGAGVSVDSALSTMSTNPVQNKVITSKVGTAALDTTAQNLSEAVNEVLGDISGFADNISDAYDSTETYAVGDLCIHDNTLYRCNTAITTAEAWNSIHWTQTTVDDEKVSKHGDTMTGALTVVNSASDGDGFIIKNPDYAMGGTRPSSSSYRFIKFRDKEDSATGQIRSLIGVNGETGIAIMGRNTTSGSATVNSLGMYVDASGNKTVALEATPWRSALGLGTSGALPITIAQGGTGATDAATAVENLGLGSLHVIDKQSISNGSSGQFSVSNSSRGVLISSGSNNATKDIFLWNCTSTGTVSYVKMGSSTGLTITTATNKITLANSGGSQTVAIMISY